LVSGILGPLGPEEIAVKRKRYSVEQIVAVLKQAELGMPVADVVRQMGITEQTFYRWKRQYAGMQSEQVREYKQLLDENMRLKKLVAELSLDKAILQDINSKKWPARHAMDPWPTIRWKHWPTCVQSAEDGGAVPGVRCLA
jgi:putative transposase